MLFENLWHHKHSKPYLRFDEVNLVVDDVGQLLLAIFHDEEDIVQRFANDNIDQVDDVWMLHRLKRIDLADAADRETILSIAGHHSLQSIDLVRLDLSSPIDDTISALADSIQLLELAHHPTVVPNAALTV